MSATVRSPDEERAREFAIRAHGDQRYGDQPYVVHLDAVHDTLVSFGHSGDILVASLLHDSVEDTVDQPKPVTPEQIGQLFGEVVQTLVWAVTGIGPTRHVRRQCAYDRMRSLGAARPTMGDKAITLKLGDRLANGTASAANNRRLFGMYANEMPGFEAALGHMGDPSMWVALRAVFAAGR
jgi:(p)ppGpp synthase/HD superfamily hydrolase